VRLILILSLIAVHCAAVLGGAPAASSASGPLIERTLFGAFVGIDPTDPRRTLVDDPAAVADYERQVGADLQIVSVFHGVGDIFPTAAERQLAARGSRALLISLDMGAARTHRFSAWSSGRHDAYLKRLGASLADYPFPVYLRPWAEMNADWVPFQPTADGGKPAGGTPAEFVRAWRHVVNEVRAAGATNVRWVFNPTADTYAQTTSVSMIYPGQQWVDVLGLDGYNWGTYPGWRSFSSIFSEQYRRLTALDPALPVWLCEFASREPSVDDGAPIDTAQSKAKWLRAAFESRDFPRIQALVYFDIKKERDWRLASSSASLGAARQELSARPAPSTRRGVAGLGVAGLAPSARVTSTGRSVLGWGRSLDPATVRYQVQRQLPGQSWAALATTSGPQWVAQSADQITGLMRVRGLDSAGALRWTSASARFGPSPRPSAALRSLADGRLSVNVNPDLAGEKRWNGRLLVLKGGVWSTVQSFSTWGAAEVRRFIVPSGTYRVNIYGGQHGYSKLFSPSFRHRR